MKSIRRLLVLATFTFALSSSAYAAPITLTGGQAGTIPGTHANNNFIGTLFGGPQIGGYFGSQIQFNAAAGSKITFDFFGAEAGYVNNFVYSGSTVFTHNGGLNIASNLATPLSTFTTTIGGSGTLPFKFKVNSGAGSTTNGTNPNDFAGLSLGANFFATCNPFSQAAGSGGTNCNSVYLFLDDGGAGPDDNHDDMLVRVSIAQVPEPATIFTGLAGLGLFIVRRQKSRQ
jgi:hypothetical protein